MSQMSLKPKPLSWNSDLGNIEKGTIIVLSISVIMGLILAIGVSLDPNQWLVKLLTYLYIFGIFLISILIFMYGFVPSFLTAGTIVFFAVIIQNYIIWKIIQECIGAKK